MHPVEGGGGGGGAGGVGGVGGLVDTQVHNWLSHTNPGGHQPLSSPISTQIVPDPELLVMAIPGQTGGEM
jgi:hypothetical protein